MSGPWLSRRFFRPALLAAMVALTSVATVAAEEPYITVTDLTLDPIAYTDRTSGTVVVTGTITCSADGELSEILTLSLTQKDARASDNLVFAGYLCSTEPTAFLAPLEYTTPCPIESRYPKCHFTAGPALLRATINGEVLVERKVLIRYR